MSRSLHIGRLQLQVIRYAPCLALGRHAYLSLRPEWIANGTTAASGAHIPLPGGFWHVSAGFGRLELNAYWNVDR